MRARSRIAAVVAVVGVLAASGGTQAESPLPSAPAPPSPSPLDTSTWTTYTSERYAFSIGHPADWSEQPADHTWTMADATTVPFSDAAEHFLSANGQVGVSAWSVAYPGAATTDRRLVPWIQNYCELLEQDSPCPDPRELSVPVTMDGHPGLLVEFVGDTQAFVLVGDTMYVVAVWRPDADPTTASYGGSARFLRSFLATMHLLPGGPETSSVPGQSASAALSSPSLCRVDARMRCTVGSLNPGRYTIYGLDLAGFNVSFAVPAGWSWDGRSLTKGAADRPIAASISFYGGPVGVYEEPCHWSEAPAPLHQSVDELLASLGAQQGRDASAPVERNASSAGLAGRWAGKTIELSVPARLDLSTCHQGQFRSWGPDARARINEGPGERDVVWAVDLETGELLTIDAGTFPDTPPDLVAEVDGILDSIKTGHWG
jgi:hypothetical protein